MRLAATTIAFNDESIIAGNILSYRPFVEKHIIVIPTVNCYGKKVEPDKTADIATSLGCEVLFVDNKAEHENRNAGLKKLQGYDYILTSESDIWFYKQDFVKFIKFLETCGSDAVSVRQNTYFKDHRHKIAEDNPQTIMAMKPGKFYDEAASVRTSPKQVHDIEIHHLAWAAPKDVYKKVSNYNHSHMFNYDEWYEKYYRNWDVSCGHCFLPRMGSRNYDKYSLIETDVVEGLFNVNKTFSIGNGSDICAK